MKYSIHLLLVTALAVTVSYCQALEVIQDNTDAGVVCSAGWTSAGAPCYGTDRFTNGPGTGTETVTYTKSVAAGWYRLDFFVGNNTTWATDARYTVTHRDGTDVLTVSQRKTTAGWYYLGTFYFNGSATVQLSDQFSGGSIVVADAIRLQSIFSFVHMSDSHVGYGNGNTCTQQCANELQTLGKVTMAGYGFDAPPPSFAIHTGDMTEYGQESWSQAMTMFAGLPFPMYCMMGNHDAAQNSNRENIRVRHGSPYYSVDYTDRGSTYHFVMLDSTALQTPRCDFSREMLDWLSADLSALPANTPVFLALHHPIEGLDTAFGKYDPKPYSTYRLLETTRRFGSYDPYNLQMIFVGHGHSFTTSVFDNVTQVEGGSTYNDDLVNFGYSIVTVTHDRIHVARKIYSQPTAALGLVNGQTVTATPTYPKINVTSPTRELVLMGSSVDVAGVTITGAAGTVSSVACELDSDGVWRALSGAGTGPYAGAVDMTGIPHGRHFIRVRFTMSTGGPYYRTVSFWNWDAYPRPRWIFDMGGSGLGAPLVCGDRLYVASEAGVVRCIETEYGAEIWSAQLPCSIMSTPDVRNGQLVVGGSDGQVYCLNASTGSVIWTANCSGQVYSSPLIDGDNVFIGSSGTGAAGSAKLYSLRLDTGAENWNYPVGCSIESRPCVLGDTVFAGAWDGYLYALYKADGSLRWHYRRNASRYYSPADAWPIASAATNRVYVADREYYMNAVNIATGLADWTRAGISGQCFSTDGTALFQRSNTEVMYRTDLENTAGWNTTYGVGSSSCVTPINPVTSGSRVAVSAAQGIATVMNVDTGVTESQFRLTPGLQLGPMAMDEDGTVFAATYDGFLICMANQDPAAHAVPDVVVETRLPGGAVLGSPTYVETGSWLSSTAKSAAGGLVAAAGSRCTLKGSKGTARVTPNIVTAGTYDVYASWNSSSNAKSVSYGIRHNRGVTTVTLDQKPGCVSGGSNANLWYRLGRFPFLAGQNPDTGSVTVDESTVTAPYSDYNTGRVYADGFRWVYRDASVPVRMSRFRAD